MELSNSTEADETSSTEARDIFRMALAGAIMGAVVLCFSAGYSALVRRRQRSHETVSVDELALLPVSVEVAGETHVLGLTMNQMGTLRALKASVSDVYGEVTGEAISPGSMNVQLHDDEGGTREVTASDHLRKLITSAHAIHVTASMREASISNRPGVPQPPRGRRFL